MNNLNINLNLYRSFYYVAKYEGFTKASYHAAISQSSLSSNIKKLEEELDTLLFNRIGSSVTLTQAGKELYSKLIDIVSILENNNNDVKEINIGCIRFVADNYLDESILKFNKKNKDIKLTFNFSYASELYQMLKKDQLDLVISRYPLFYKFDKDMVIEKLFDAENVFVCSKRFYEKECKKLSNEKYKFPMILPDASEKRRNIEQYLIDNEINFDVVFEVPSSNLLIKLIKEGTGIGYINKKFIEEEVKNGNVVILDNFKNLPIDNISVIYNSKKINLKTKEFIDVLKHTI